MEIYERTHMGMSLPSRMGGLNLSRQQPLAPCAFLATMHAVLLDPLMASLKEHVVHHIDEAFSQFYANFVGVAPLLVAGMIKGFPPNTAALVEACNTSSLKLKSKRLKMQSRLTQATNVFARSTLADLCDPE